MIKLTSLSLAALTTGALLVGCASGAGKTDSSSSGNMFARGQAAPNSFWWPEIIDLTPLRQHSPASNPMGKSFNYAQEFNKLNLVEVKRDIEKVLKTSQDWWPADYGHYGPLIIRMAWHSAGTYRVWDGRGGAGGGQQRFEPLNSWPDNANLDKARRLLWPVKMKYGKRLSWADLMVLAGNVSLESMGFKTYGFAGGREDDWEADLVYWGPETKMLGSDRFTGSRKVVEPLAAIHMGLIYVNPEGPNGNGDPLSAAADIRESFGLMAMNDEETVALIAGGHSFGKAHGARKPECVGNEPAAEGTEHQGFGWNNRCGTGKGADTVTSGLEGAWTATPVNFSSQFLANLFAFEWKRTKSPAGATQWIPTDPSAANMVPDAHDKTKRHAPIMLTTDLALKVDPEYRKISERFLKNPEEFRLAFAKAWFKLTHRDLGPKSRYLGPEVPREELVWQDINPKRNHNLIDSGDIARLKSQILKSGLSTQELVRTAWASAATYRGTDMRGGANGARIRLAPQKDWEANDPAELSKVLSRLEGIQSDFNRGLGGGKKVSLADVIVLGGAAAIEDAAGKAGFKNVKVPFTPGRTDASQEQIDVLSFKYLEPKADAFRNYYSSKSHFSPTLALVDRANLLTLTVPETTVLIGGLRSLGANHGGSKHGVFTDRPGALSNDFFVNLLDMSTRWQKSKTEGLYEGIDRKSGRLKWTATPVDLIFGSHAELRAISEVYAANDGKEKFLRDFVTAWNKVMTLAPM